MENERPNYVPISFWSFHLPSFMRIHLNHFISERILSGVWKCLEKTVNTRNFSVLNNENSQWSKNKNIFRANFQRPKKKTKMQEDDT